MILFLVFLSLFIGINVRVSIVLGIIELIIILLFAFFRFGKKILTITFITASIGVGISFIRFDFDKKNYVGVVENVKDNYLILNSTFERLYIHQKEHQYEIGDILNVYGKKKELDFSTLESGFDFSSYLNSKGVYKELVVYKIEVKFSTPFKLHKIKKEFLSHFANDSRSLIGSFLFSISSDSDLYDSASELHLMRLISNSGIYLSALYVVYSFLISYLVKKDKAKDLVCLGLFIPTLIFSFPRFVVIKFFTLKLLRWINSYLLKGKYSYLELVSISGIGFLLLDYHLGYQDGFLLTYFIPIIALFFNGSFRGYKKRTKKIIVVILTLLSFVPFAIKYYHEIAPLSSLFQVILSPLFLLYYFLSLLSFIGLPIYSFLDHFAVFIATILKAISALNIKIYAADLSTLGIFFLEMIYLINIYYLASRFKPMIKISLTIFIAFNLMIFIPIKNLAFDQVSFINVGQGDATLIRRNNTAILIDTGGSIYQDIAKESLIPFLKKNRVYDIDLLITTHDDFDHSGAVTSLTHNFKVKRYVKDYQLFPISIGGFTLKNYNVYPNLWQEENDESLVIGFSTHKYSYLITGDAPIKIERQIMKDNKSIPCDILKVGHHGSKTSTCEEFVKYLNPTVGIISCGKNNKYGHPNSEVTSLLRKYHVIIRRTDLEGTITYWQ